MSDGDVQRRVAEVLAGHPDWRYEEVARGQEQVVCWCGFVLREYDAHGRIVPQLAAHQAAVLAAEGLLARDDAGFTPQGLVTLAAGGYVAPGGRLVTGGGIDCIAPVAGGNGAVAGDRDSGAQA